MRIRLLALIFLLFPAASGLARIISYSPYTDRSAFPAHQHRMNRHFALVEMGAFGPLGPGPGIPTPPPVRAEAEVVLYDYRGEKEPRKVFPTGEGRAYVASVAVRENSAGVPSLLVAGAIEGATSVSFYLSTDAGASWRPLEIPGAFNIPAQPSSFDTGGPFVAARGSQVRIGTEEWPFVVSSGNALHVIGSSGVVKSIANLPTTISSVRLIGTDRSGRYMLVNSNAILHIVDIVTGAAAQVDSFPSAGIDDGWITPAGHVYAEERGSVQRFLFLNGSSRSALVEAPATTLGVFGVPTNDYAGAWIIERGPGKPTILHKHTVSGGLQKQWEDITAPEVEALHAGMSGTRVLIQVHRPRPQADQRIFQDPALAVWHVGQPAPRFYDELYMDEQWNKGFVHLDVDRLEQGEPFVFDSGVRFAGGGGGGVSPSTPPSGGGGDVVQEWGVVRASLKQRLVLPAVGRTPGAFDSYWVTDVIIQNPSDAPQRVDIRFAPSGATNVAAESARSVTLAAREIRLIEDVLLSLFGLESGLGAFFIEPESGIVMTSRTYSKSANGTYGFGMNAMDVYAAAASARFPLTFAGAFLGQNYRTNIVVTDAGDSGSRAAVRAAGPSGLLGLSNVSFEVAPRGQQQYNSISPQLGLYPHETGALLFRPINGSATASIFATDNRTNDATYFPPDLPAPIVRTIPAVGHVDGANNAHFRSDIYLYNPSSTMNMVMLQFKMWDSPEMMTINLTMLPNEARVIPDVLQTLFGRSGIARLRYQSIGTTGAVRVTSRTYSLAENGGTYGFLMPPLNNFQSGGMGDTLEILGSVSAADYRTNIGLVDLNAFTTGNAINVRVEIIDRNGNTADSFTATVPSAGGMQLNDVFRNRGINVSGPVLIKVSPLNGIVGAYATFIDNRTNDAVYLAANLGAKE